MKNVWIRGLVLTSMLATGPCILLACDHNEHSNAPDGQHPEMARADQGSSDVGRARGRIVAARCDREERCSNVGSGRSYETRDVCTSKLDGTTGSDLNLSDCPHGIDQPKLSECLSKIHTEDCGNPLDSLSRLVACRTGALCASAG